jgi:hypothetical protein
MQDLAEMIRRMPSAPAPAPAPSRARAEPTEAPTTPTTPTTPTARPEPPAERYFSHPTPPPRNEPDLLLAAAVLGLAYLFTRPAAKRKKKR